MIIGSGPIVIGQAAEFDYAGTQACRALKFLGLEVVLVNSNPATIMTDTTMADRIYIEPLTVEVLQRIIQKEKPDGLMSTMGGQNGLTLSMQLAKSGFLAEHNVTLLGAKPDTIDRAEDRLLFKQTMEKIEQPCIPSEVVTEVDDALTFAEQIGYPVIVRPAFTLGGSGGGIAQDSTELAAIAKGGLAASPITQVLIEKCISGWKEIEFEVMRDAAGNSIAICSMENLDPVGIHTGDSIVIAPAVTLSHREYQMLRFAALTIVDELGVEGGCNVQFALHPTSFEYAVIEVNPRVSRSSALASKATGYPIAKVAAQIAVGLRLDEIDNAVTGKTKAFFEPALDYIVVKFPRWPFDKFVYASRTLGTQMKATGEVMAIAPTFEQALMKAVRGAEISLDTLTMPRLAELDDEQLTDGIKGGTDERLFMIYEAMKRGVSAEEIHDLTMIDMWFLSRLGNLLHLEQELVDEHMNKELYLRAKQAGFPDQAIKRLSNQELPPHLPAVYQMVDTCAGEFAAQTPYFYAAYNTDNEAAEFIEQQNSGKKRIIVFGSGPIRIGQGIEFDYASVHCVRTLKELGYEVVMVNNNPETVSTDFDTADRLYFEPLFGEDVMDIIATEKPYGTVVAFGGQTAIKLTRTLAENGVRILGTSADSIDTAEDRERFDAILNKLGVQRPKGHGVFTKEEALAAAHDLGYPVLIRPSYVLGGQNMIIAFSDETVERYMDIILANGAVENPILVDKYLMGLEVEVDAICDGEDVLLPGIMEHVERAGVHSGDSIAIYPPRNLSGPIMRKLCSITRTLAVALKTHGLINVQFVIHHNQIYIIEANPRASRTVPYMSKVTGLPIVELATRAMLGERIVDMGYAHGLYQAAAFKAVKVPVFSFEKLSGVDTMLGPEMKSTGEVLGIGRTLEEAMYKGLLSAGYSLAAKGGLLITVQDRDKPEIIATARRFADKGFKVYATAGTAELLNRQGIAAQSVGKLYEGKSDIVDLIENGKINYVISTSETGKLPHRDSVQLRRRAVKSQIACLTSIDTANVLADVLESGYNESNMELVDIARLSPDKQKLSFIKMRGSGSDGIYFDCFEQKIDSPRSLAVRLTNRSRGIGGDAIVLIEPSDLADANMRVFNVDGSPEEIGGNAIRCVAKYLYDSGRMPKTRLCIETHGQIREMELFIQDGEVFSITVDMGKPDFDAASVPVNRAGPVINQAYSSDGYDFHITCLSMGNPHCIVFVQDVDTVEMEKLGPVLENAAIFPQRANVAFATVTDESTIRMRAWERGTGETLASGDSACAVLAAATEQGLCPMDTDILIRQRGGSLIVKRTASGVFMTGDAAKDFEGIVEI